MLDCVIRGGVVVDGTGAAGFAGDVGVRDGRIVSVGEVDEPTRRVVDADGRVVAPGFVDIHTHYDAQVMWDPAVTPSSLHGVTTAIGGNCGFSIAPVSTASADYVMRMLACVEGMPVEALEAGLDFGWESFGDWLALLDGRLAVNSGFLVGHSTVRRLVMGEDCHGTPSIEQLAQMVQIVDESVREGALGFSSSWGELHADHQGNPVPSRGAGTDELMALASVLRDHPGTILEFIPTIDRLFSDDVAELMAAMSSAANSMLNWNVLTIGTDESNRSRLAPSDRARARGAEVVALALPIPLQLRVNLMTAINYNSMPTWRRILSLPLDELLVEMAVPEARARMAQEVADQNSNRVVLDFARMTVESVVSPEVKPLEGRIVGDIARERGCTALEAFLDVAIADRLQTCFKSVAAGDDPESWAQRAEHWQDPRVLVGGSDAGAHLDALAAFGFFTDFVGPTVRDRGLIGLEDAIHKITDLPARKYGLEGRGRIEAGWYADLVVFDPDTVRNGSVVLRADMPGGQSRLYADAVGIDHVIVNGTEIVDHGELTGATPGTVLRSGRDQLPA